MNRLQRPPNESAFRGSTGHITIRDVATLAGVSTGTVSRVLNGYGNISPGLRARVQTALTELNYYPLRKTRSRRTSTVSEIGFVLTLPHLDNKGDLMSPFWARILQGAEREARTVGAAIRYHCLHVAGRTSADIGSELNELQLDAALIVGAASADTIQALRGIGIPFVLVDSISPDQQADAVVSDWLGGAQEAVEHLIAAGHQAIGFVGGPLLSGSRTRNAIHSLEQRATGYRNALFHAGIPLDVSWMESTELNPEGGYVACRRLLDRAPELTALFCANDATASGVLRGLADVGFAVPKQASVIGFDDDLADHTNPQLTTVRVDKEGMGALAVRTLLARCARPDAPWVRLVLPVQLITRQSVGPSRASHDLPSPQAGPRDAQERPRYSPGGRAPKGGLS